MSTKVPATPYPTPYPGQPSGVGTFYPSHPYASSFGGHPTLGSGLVAYYKHDETSGIRASSTGSYNLTPSGTVSFETGVLGNGSTFNGSGLNPANHDRLASVGAAPAISSIDGFTVCGWLKGSASVHNTWFMCGNVLFVGQPSIMFTDAGIAGNYLIAYFSSNGVGAAGSDLSAATVAPATLSDTTYKFVSAWFDPTDNKMHGSVNNGATQNAANAITVGLPFTTQTTVGMGFGWGIAGDAPYMGGAWDEVGMWSRVLTSAERTALYNGGVGLSY